MKMTMKKRIDELMHTVYRPISICLLSMVSYFLYGVLEEVKQGSKTIQEIKLEQAKMWGEIKLLSRENNR